ncbi:unnamed protein product [Mytilus coruscus]|uniref:Uncharacterized protein n=1 Tax=Mytilus coruscus TaxID=42192 RepID=A0A6J8D763_MYTCO|nr:unnamed protein product [Mytilus coruscus]
MQHPLILDDFLLANKATIHYPTRTLYLHDGTIQVALISTKQVNTARNFKTVSVPGLNMCEIPVIIPKHYLNKPVILELHDYLEKYQLMVASCLVQATRSKNARVRMQNINPNNYTITLPVNTVVAMVSYVDVSTLQILSEENSNLKKKKSKIDFDLSSADLTEDEKKN